MKFIKPLRYKDPLKEPPTKFYNGELGCNMCNKTVRNDYKKYLKFHEIALEDKIWILCESCLEKILLKGIKYSG